MYCWVFCWGEFSTLLWPNESYGWPSTFQCNLWMRFWVRKPGIFCLVMFGLVVVVVGGGQSFSCNKEVRWGQSSSSGPAAQHHHWRSTGVFWWGRLARAGGAPSYLSLHSAVCWELRVVTVRHDSSSGFSLGGDLIRSWPSCSQRSW